MSPEPNLILRALLRELGCTQAALAAAVNTAGAEIGVHLTYDRSTVAHWLAGAQPRSPTPQLVAAVLSRHTGRNISVAATGFREEHHSHDAILGRLSETGHSGTEPALAQFTRIAADPTHEDVLQHLPYRPGSRPSPPREAADRPGASPGAPQRAHVPVIEAASTFFATELDEHGGGQGRTSLSKYLEHVVAPRLRSCPHGEARLRMLIQAARLIFILGRMYVDTTRNGAAHYCFRMAAELANEANAPAMWGIAARTMASQALQLGHRSKAIEYSEAAVDALTPATPPAVRAFVFAQAAVTRASAISKQGAYNALAQAEQACRMAPASSDPFESYSVAALSFQSAEMHEKLGDTRAAIDTLRHAAEVRPLNDRRGRALTQARRAQLYLRTGELDHSCACWSEFLSLSSDLRSHTAMHSTRTMRRELRPYARNSQVRDLLDRTARRGHTP